MSEARWQWPAAPVRTSALGTIAVAAAALVVVAWAAHDALPAGPRVPILAAALFAAVMLPAIGFLPGHHPFDRFGPANQVSTGRAALTAVAVACALEPPRPGLAALGAIVGLVVTALDGFDGAAARRSRMASAFGARFDLEIDAALIMALAVIAWRHDKAGVWVLLSGLLRYLFVAAGWLWPRLARPLPPSRRRQTVCVLQVAGLIIAVAPIVARPGSAAIAAAALAALCYSFSVDVLWLGRRAP